MRRRHVSIWLCLGIGCAAPPPDGESAPTDAVRIGPDGGTARWGDVVLSLPPGALSETTELRFASAAAISAPGFVRCSPLVALAPAGLSLARPARLILPIDTDCPVAPRAFARGGAATDAWRRQPARCGARSCEVTLSQLGPVFAGGFSSRGIAACGAGTCAPPEARCEDGWRALYGPAHACDEAGRCVHPSFLDPCASRCTGPDCACAATEDTGCFEGHVVRFDACGQPLARVATCDEGCDERTGRCQGCQSACGARACGAEPTCGESCGACGAGAICSGDGQCMPAVCDAGQRRCVAGGSGFESCDASSDAPGGNRWGDTVPCAAGCAEGACRLAQACRSAEVLVLFDRSAAMATVGDWDAGRRALVDELAQRAPHNRVGLMFAPAPGMPDDGCRAADAPRWGGADADFDADGIAPSTAAGVPLAASLMGLAFSFSAPRPGQSVVVVTAGTDLCAGADAAESAAAKLFARGVRVHVIRVGASADVVALDRVARAGGTRRSVPADDEATLRHAVHQAFEAEGACRYRPRLALLRERPGEGALSLSWSDPSARPPERSAPGLGEASGVRMFDVAWSPNGAHLAFLARGAATGAPVALHWLERPDALGPTRPEKLVGEDGAPVTPTEYHWLADGRLLWRAPSGADGRQRITVFDPKTKATYAEVSSFRPLGMRFAPVGAAIALVDWLASDGNAPVLALRVGSVGASALRHGPVGEGEQLRVDAPFLSTIQFSPDGQRLAFLARRGSSGPRSLFVGEVREDGLAALRSVSPESSAGQFRATAVSFAWAPDARHIALMMRVPRDAGGNFREVLYLVAADGGRPPRALTDTSGPFGAFAYRWAPTGGHLAYVHVTEVHDGALVGRLRVAHPDRGSTVSIEGGVGARFSWSHDGRFLAHASVQRGLQVAEIDDAGSVRAVHSDLGDRTTGALAWHPSEALLMYADRAAGLRLFDAARGDGRALGGAAPPGAVFEKLRGLGWSPRGDALFLHFSELLGGGYATAYVGTRQGRDFPLGPLSAAHLYRAPAWRPGS